MSGPPDGLLEVGAIGKAHGLGGDVLVTLHTNRTERVDPGSVLHLGDGRTLVVVAASAHQHRHRVRFDGIAGREAAEALRGEVLYAEPIDDPDELWAHDLIDHPVVLVDGTEVGTCVALVDNPVHDQLELDTGYLVPVVFVVEAGDRVVIDPPEGLFDL